MGAKRLESGLARAARMNYCSRQLNVVITFGYNFDISDGIFFGEIGYCTLYPTGISVTRYNGHTGLLPDVGILVLI